MSWPAYGSWSVAGFVALALAAAVAVSLAWRRRARLPGVRFPARHRLAGVAPGWRARLVHLPLVLRFASVALILLALTRPQLTSAETAEVEGIDIVVAFDMSGSMASVDVSDEALVRLQNAGREPRNRFEIATAVLEDFIRSRKYDRVSLVAFGKESFLMFPLTLDYGVMLDVIGKLQLEDIDGSGTAIGNALAMSLARLKDSSAKTRLVILLTDGDDNASKVSPMEMAHEAARRGVHVFTILVGTDEQSRMPTRMQDFLTGHRVYQKTTSPVNPKLLQEIADLTGGKYYRAADQAQLASDFRDILDRFEKTRLVDYAAAERTEVYVRFLLPALLLLLVEVLLGQTLLRRFP